MKSVLVIFGFVLLSMSLLRFILFSLYHESFTLLSNNETILSFLMGVRVDIIVLCIIFALPSLLFFLPFSFISNKLIQKAIYVLLFVFISIVIGLIVADILYFEHVHRHIASEIYTLLDDTHIIFDMAELHIDKIGYFLLYELLLLFVFKRTIKTDTQMRFSLKNLALFLSVMLLLFLGIRNSISGKPFGLADAFVTNKTASGNLAINGVFSIVKNFKKQKIYCFYKDDFALNELSKALVSDEFSFVDNAYPLLRQIRHEKSKKYNIVIIMLESWSSKYIDSFTHNSLGVTKNFDKMANEGLRFNNFFANGQRSVDGITALFTGLPVLPHFQYLGHGLELSRLSYLANSAKNEGYTTLAMQSSKRGSFRVDAIAKLSGFDEYYGAEDFPVLAIESSGKKPRFGAWDNDMFAFYFDKLNSLKEPFLGFTFSSSTHIPFISPGKKWEKYPHDDNHIFGFLNTLNYADEALGIFMEKAKKTSWFDNTIFIFLADHTLGFGNQGEPFKDTNITMKGDRILEHMRIPLLIYAPKIFKPAIIDKIASQADILPSLSHFLGWKSPFASVSNSIFSNSDKAFVLFANGNTLGLINKKGYITHNLQNTLENTLNEEAKIQLLSFYQSLSSLLKQNKISPK